jgi:hypothetical protein
MYAAQRPMHVRETPSGGTIMKVTSKSGAAIAAAAATLFLAGMTNLDQCTGR